MEKPERLSAERIEEIREFAEDCNCRDCKEQLEILAHADALAAENQELRKVLEVDVLKLADDFRTHLEATHRTDGGHFDCDECSMIAELTQIIHNAALPDDIKVLKDVLEFYAREFQDDGERARNALEKTR